MKESVSVRFLYGTVPGRLALRLLTQPGVSKAAGRFLSSHASAGIVPHYIRKHGIDLTGVEVPEGGFPSFNAFFTRRRRDAFAGLEYDTEYFCDAEGRRRNVPGDSCDADCKSMHNINETVIGNEDSGNPENSANLSTGLSGCLHSPCDGFLTPIPIRGNAIFDVKHTRFSLEDLLRDRALAARFRDGLALVFRLTPANYHRYCYAADGTVLRHRKISGKLHCVRPIALREIPVFAQNSREYQLIRTKKFGMMVQMEIGALLVGRICNERLTMETNYVHAREEKGYFEFGGSTIILLLEKDAVRFCKKLYERTNENGEIPVRAGEEIADRC